MADLPLDRLAAEAGEIARRWAAALVLLRPLRSVGRIALSELARDAPSLCAQVIRALGSDEQLELLLAASPEQRGGAFADMPAALSGARGASGVVEAVEALRGVIWEGLLDELHAGRTGREGERRLGEAADRLAHVCAALGARAAERVQPGARSWRFPEPPPAPGANPEARIVIVDERGLAQTGERAGEAAEAERAHRAEPSIREQRTGAAAGRSHEHERRPLAAVSGASARREQDRPRPEIAIRDARREEGPAAWINSIGAELDRYERERLPFAVVLIEVVAAREGGSAPSESEVESALAAELRSAGGGSLTRERAGRWWLLAPRADRIGTHELALRLERAVAAAAALTGAPVRIATGTAVCPEDGTQAAALAAHADIGLYAARWDSRAGAPRRIIDEAP